MRLFINLSVALFAISTVFAAPVPTHSEEHGVAHHEHHSQHVAHHNAHVEERGIDFYDSELFERSFEPEFEFEELSRREPLILTEQEQILNGLRGPNRNKPLPPPPGHNKPLPPHPAGRDKPLPEKPLPAPPRHHKRTPIILTEQEQILNGLRGPNRNKPLPPPPGHNKPLPPHPAGRDKPLPEKPLPAPPRHHKRTPIILTEQEQILNGLRGPNRNKPLPPPPGHNKPLPPHPAGRDKPLPEKPLPAPPRHHKRTPEPLILTEQEQILNGLRGPNKNKPLPPPPGHNKPLPPHPGHNKPLPKKP